MAKAPQSHLKQLIKYDMFLGALRRNEGFRRETDKAFAKFWEREGDSLRKRELHEVDTEGNTLLITLLGDLIEKPDSDPHVLDAYCYSPEAHQMRQKYGLYYPFHYNQGRPGQLTITSPINATGFAGTIDGQTVWMFRYPCLQGFRNQSLTHLDIRIDLTWPKEEIMNIFEMVLDDALREKERGGEKTKKRGREVDSLPFRVWDMQKEGKSTWPIAQEFFPHIKGESPREWHDNYSESARSHLRKVERALKKANELIASITTAS